MKKLLIIQTAFIGDVILATSLVDLVKANFPDAQIDFCLRKGNESIMESHPQINRVWIWSKSNGKYRNLIKLAWKIRKEQYDIVFNIQRFFNSGLLTAFSNAKISVGFNKNPLSFFFTHKVNHLIPYPIDDSNLHEVQRNALLLQKVIDITLPDAKSIPPTLHPTKEQQQKVYELTKELKDYLVLAPASVWFTKQWAQEKWQELTHKLSKDYELFFIGAPADKDFITSIIDNHANCHNLCGSLSLLESAALMKNAKRVFVNDSAPLHLASGVNAKVTAIFCSTATEFGYTPLTHDFKVIQLNPKLDCMPCGLHGHKSCPLGHFKCAHDIPVSDVIATIE